MTIDVDAMGVLFIVGFLVVVARDKPLEIFGFSAFYMLLLMAGALT